MAPSSSARSCRRDSDISLPLPSGFSSLRDILDGDVRVGTLTNVCGIIKDFRPPITTRKADWKATMTLIDISTEHDYEGIEFSIFRPKDNIPTVNAGDAVLLYRVKVQSWNNNPISLITNHQTMILVYSGAKIPKYPRPANNALQPRAGKETVKPPSEIESVYVSYFYHKIDKGAVPEPEEFQLMTMRALNVKEKFSLLQDIQESKFCDLIVQVCRDPYDLGDRMTLYVTDYTENDAFFNYTYEGVRDLEPGGGDMYGYTSKRRDGDGSDKWVGPYGKRTLQVTAWEPHAEIIREDVRAGDWISLRNLQIKTARDGSLLEGALREERNQPITSKINVAVLDTQDKDTIEPRLKDAIRRWRDYAKEKNKQVKTLKSSQGGKRKRPSDDTAEVSRQNTKTRRQLPPADDTDDLTESSKQNEASKPNNAKERRQRKRAEAQTMVKEKEKETKLKEEVRGLNPLIVCEMPPDRPLTRVASILEQNYYSTTIGKNKVRLPLPFVCAKYLANVRVVDFRPQTLEDFARPRTLNAFDVLSDNGSDADSAGSEADDNDGSNVKWEWRFSLLLEDASPKAQEPKRVWVVVNNMDGQYLTNLDASNLRSDDGDGGAGGTAALAALRRKLFVLWGTLEERKHWLLQREKAAAEERRRRPGVAPPPTMSDEDEDGGNSRQRASMKGAPPVEGNKPFTCCIQQYGVEEAEDDPALADAGEGRRWKRTLGLFGTRIHEGHVSG